MLMAVSQLDIQPLADFLEAVNSQRWLTRKIRKAKDIAAIDGVLERLLINRVLEAVTLACIFIPMVMAVVGLFLSAAKTMGQSGPVFLWPILLVILICLTKISGAIRTSLSLKRVRHWIHENGIQVSPAEICLLAYENRLPRRMPAGIKGIAWLLLAAFSLAVILLGLVVTLLHLAGVFIFGLGVLIWGYADRLRIPGSGVLEEIDQRRRILYLRAFRDDKQVDSKQRGLGFQAVRTRIEDILVRSLWGIGPVIAIGKPGDVLPASGALREYVPHETWQERVKVLEQQSLAVLLLVGRTPGIEWEIERIKSSGSLGKTLFAIPPVRSRRDRMKRIELLLRHLPAAVNEYTGKPNYIRALNVGPGGTRIYTSKRDSVWNIVAAMLDCSIRIGLVDIRPQRSLGEHQVAYRGTRILTWLLWPLTLTLLFSQGMLFKDIFYPAPQEESGITDVDGEIENSDTTQPELVQALISDELSHARTIDRVVKSEKDAISFKNAGDSFRDCATCPDMVVLPQGAYQMGSPEYDPGKSEDDTPQHPVEILYPLAISRYEITREEFAAFVSDTNRQMSWCTDYNPETNAQVPVEGMDWQSIPAQEGSNHPVACVSWEDASEYASWLSESTGKRYRLPSEAEWEYAARAGSTTIRYWGDEPDRNCDYENVVTGVDDTGSGDAASCADGYVFTSPVGSFMPNDFGLYDMLGNLHEWVQDCNNLYMGIIQRAHKDGRPIEAGNCEQRVLRGGSFLHTPEELRVSARIAGERVDRMIIAGFRVVRVD